MQTARQKELQLTHFHQETHMRRPLLAAFFIMSVASCTNSNPNGAVDPNGVIFIEDTPTSYLVIRHAAPGYVRRKIRPKEHRPDLEDVREIHGDLYFIFSELYGCRNWRIIIDSKDTHHYEVIYQEENQKAISRVADELGLAIRTEEREIRAITIRQSAKGHTLIPSLGKKSSLDDISVDEFGRCPLEGVSMDQLASILEICYQKPVVNLTAVKGDWSITLSEKILKTLPTASHPVISIDNTGLE